MHSIVIIVNQAIIIYLKIDERVDLKCPYHKKEMVNMWPVESVS